MKQGEMVVFLVTAEEFHGLSRGHPIGIRPTNGMRPFFIMLDPQRVTMPVNGQPPRSAPPEKGYTVHRRPLGKGKGRFECTCGATAKTLSRLFRHQKKAHAAA